MNLWSASVVGLAFLVLSGCQPSSESKLINAPPAMNSSEYQPDASAVAKSSDLVGRVFLISFGVPLSYFTSKIHAPLPINLVSARPGADGSDLLAALAKRFPDSDPELVAAGNPARFTSAGTLEYEVDLQKQMTATAAIRHEEISVVWDKVAGFVKVDGTETVIENGVERKATSKLDSAKPQFLEAYRFPLKDRLGLAVGASIFQGKGRLLVAFLAIENCPRPLPNEVSSGTLALDATPKATQPR